MFKKEFKLTSNNQLSGKDKDKLKSQLSELFEKDSVAHLFKKSKKIVMQKVSGSPMVIYSNENYPVFVDTSKKGDFFPTVWCCMAYPDLTKKLEIHTKVDQFIYKGANLKWPGVNKQEDIKEFEADDVVSIVLADQTPIAVGAMACDYEDWKDDDEETDQAAFILHHINDKLADVLDVDIDEEVEVEFSKSEQLQKEKEEEEARKKEQEEEEERARKQQEEEENEEDEEIDMTSLAKKPQRVAQQTFDDEEPVEQVSMSLPQKRGKNKGRQQQQEEESKDDMFEDDNPKGKKGKGKKGKGGAKGKKNTKNDDDDELDEKKDLNKEAASSGPAIPVAVMDDYIKEAFFNALKLSVDDKMLPLDPSVLLSKHMQLCKRESITIDWKNSSYKKIGKFVQVMAKDGVIEYKEGKKGTAPSITRIFRSNQELQEWQPTISRAQTKKQDDEEESKNNTDNFVLKIKVSQNYQPKSNLVTLFGDENCTKKTYSLQQVKDATMAYAKKEKLLEKKYIVLDPYLANLVGNTKEEEDDDRKEEGEGGEEEEQQGKKKTKKGESQATITQQVLIKKIEANLIVGHTIQDSNGKVTEHKGKFKGLTIIAEKSHNKNVTKVQGLEPYGFNFDKLAEKFKLQFACSVSKGEITTGKKLKLKEKPDHELICHANTLDDLKDFFTLECKIPEDQITTINKLNKQRGKGGFQK